MPQTPTRLLLWSPSGSGEHYSGPATLSYRLYQLRNRDELLVSLAHGFPKQTRDPLFENQFQMGRHSCGTLGGLPFTMAGTRWLKHHARDFDLVHGMSGFQVTVRPCFEAHRRGVATVMMITVGHGDLADKSGWKRILALPAKRRQMARQFDAIVALSREIEQELLQYGFEPQRIARIPNFADTNRFCPASSALEKERLRHELGMEDLPTIVFVGEVCQRKQPHLILEALAALRRDGLDAQAVFVGPNDEADPAYIAMLTAKIKELGLHNRVKMTGFCTNVELWNRAADVYCLPSKKEGMPGALVEALASGLPCVVTPFSGAADVVQAELLGTIVEPEIEPIKRAFLSYLASPAKLAQCRVACRQRAEERFSATAAYRAHLELFQRILAGKPARV